MQLVSEMPYKCDQCGKIGPWIKGQWIAWVWAIKDRKYSFYEHEFHLCSDACFRALKKTPKKDLKEKVINSLKQQS